MIYVHSFSEIEQQLSKLLAPKCAHSQVDIQSIHSLEYLERIHSFSNQRTLLYSFQKFDNYKHLHSFQNEIKQVEILLEHAVKEGFEKLILISYPGAYPSSDNLFLQHKGLIEQMFISTKIPCTILRVQGISSPPMHLNNFHPLFYQFQKHQYLIPRNGHNVVYAINLLNLVDIVFKSKSFSLTDRFDVFDQVYSLKRFLQMNSTQIKIRSISIHYLFFLSYFGKYCTPTMFELFVRTNVPMYNFRTEKAFDISLHAEMFDQLKASHIHTLESDYIYSKKGQLVPVT